MKFHLILLLGLSVVFTGLGATVPPAAPSNVAATIPTMVSVNLTWQDNSTNETNFRIFSRLGTNGNFNQIGQVSANTTNFTATSLTPNQIYQFRIQARADSLTTDSEILTVQLPIINSPGNLTATLTAPTTVELRWTDDSTNEVNYVIGFRIGTNGSFGLAGTLPANSTNATIPGLSSSTTYQFLVETVGPGPNVFADSIIVTVVVGNFLTAPTNLTVVATGPGSANLTWVDTSTNEAAFFIGWRPNTTGSFSLFPGGSLASNITSFTANGLAPGSTNQFFIEAFVDNNNVADSATVTVVMPPFRAPSNLTATALNPSQIRLTWKDNTTNETKYFVAYRIGTNGYTVPTDGELPANATNFTFTNLAANTTYELLVEAYYDDFTVADATILKAAQALLAPSNLTTTALSPSQLRLTWKDNATNENRYYVAYRTDTNGNFTVPPDAELPANSTNYTFTNLAAGTLYQLLVQSYYDDSAVASTFILGSTQVLLAPSNLTATALSPSQLRLTWKDNATNENRYFVAYRAGTNGNFTVPTDAELPANSTNFTFTNLAAGTLYELLVQSYYDDFAVASTSILGSTHVLLAPSNLTATALSPSQVRLTWKDNATNETKFLVAYRIGSSGGFTVPQGGELPVNSTNFTVTNLSPGTAYEFLVQTYYDASASQQATVNSMTPDGFNSRAFHPAVLDQPISAYTLSATSNAEAPTLFGVAGLPPGLNFDGVDQITGTPLQAGVFVAQLTAQYPVAGTVTNPLTFRVIHPAGPPVVVSNLPNQTLATNSAPVLIPLNPHFTDPDTETAVRFVTTKGTYDLAIYNTATPQTAAYFLGYVDRGDYSNSVINRASPSGFQNFVLQSGALRPSGTNFTLTPTTPSPINEPGIQHVRGTLALAKQAGRPNSGSIDWFINLKDNSGELDDQNQGFAAFARVCANGISVADSILALPRNDYTVTVDGLSRSYEDWPLDTTPPAPAMMDSTKLVLVNSVTRIPTLTYAIEGNSAPAVASVAVNGSNLVVTPLTQFGGAATISIAATDLDGNSVTNAFTVQVAGAFTTWANSFSLTGSNALPSANGDGDRLPNAAEFALMSSPAVSNSTASLITNSLVTVSNAQYLALTFRLRKDLGGAVVLVRGASPLGSAWATIWTSADLNGPLVVQKTDQGDAWLLTVRDSVPAGPAGSARFLNVQVQTPP